MEKERKMAIIYVVCFFIVGYFAIKYLDLEKIYNYTTSSNNSLYESGKNNLNIERVEDRALRDTLVTNVKWKKDGFGNILIASITISNRGVTPVKDITVKILVFGESKTQIDTKTKTLYSIIPIGGTKTFDDVNFGFVDSQVAFLRAEIIGVKLGY